ncbi:hypothetical protein M5689_010902 [Euphorbia peplus]|nr:hypothetical protein M5689_010902 [Euphorbia peplus]
MSKNTSNEVFPCNVVDPHLLADINSQYLEEETSISVEKEKNAATDNSSKRGPKMLTISVIEPEEEEIDDDITLRNFIEKKRKLTSVSVSEAENRIQSAGVVGGEGVDALKGCNNDHSDDSFNISVEGMDSFEGLDFLISANTPADDEDVSVDDEDVSGDNDNNRIVPFVPKRTLCHQLKKEILVVVKSVKKKQKKEVVASKPRYSGKRGEDASVSVPVFSGKTLN